MSASQIRFFALVRREVTRFTKIKRQTLGAPLLETFLYISVFGAALGSRIDELHGIDYVVFIIPGLIMMAWAINAFSNNSSSILQQKFQRAIDDQLSSPASPAQLLLAFSLGGFLRGMIVAALTFTAASFLVDIGVEHILVLIPSLFLVGFFFSQLGVLVGVRAEQFDDVSFAQTFVLQPLIFLGGVFYSASLLDEPFQTLTHFNPIYYMINLVRYGFLGYTEANIALSLGVLALATAALFATNLRLFQTGYKLRRLDPGNLVGPGQQPLHVLVGHARGGLGAHQQGGDGAGARGRPALALVVQVVVDPGRGPVARVLVDGVQLPMRRSEHCPAVEGQHRQVAERQAEDEGQVLVRLLLPPRRPHQLESLCQLFEPGSAGARDAMRYTVYPVEAARGLQSMLEPEKADDPVHVHEQHGIGGHVWRTGCSG